MYALQKGPSEKFIIEQCVRQRLPLPPAIQDAPELYVGLELYYSAFFRLTTQRGSGYSSEGPIGWLTMMEYATVMGLDPDQTEDLLYHVSHMDAAYLEHKAAELKRKTGKQPSTK